MYQWLNEGLSPFSFIEDSLAVRKVYKQLRRLFEACWLIHEREIKRHTLSIYNEVKAAKAIKPLQNIIDLLTQTIPTDTIYNLSKDENAPDLMIVLDKSCNKAYAEFEPLIEMSLLGFDRAGCTVHNYGHLKELINNGHLFYSAACNASNLIYQQHETPFVQLGLKQFEWAKSEAEPKFDIGMAKATYFYRGAQPFFKEEANNMAVFMLQQACELTYRCLLQVFRGKDVKCHSPAVLRKYVRRYAPEVIGVFSEEETEEVRYLGILEEAYIKARYDASYTIDLETLQFLNERVGLLQETAIQSFRNKMQILADALVLN